MKQIIVALIAVTIVSALVMAQDNTKTNPASANGNTWTGLLVAAGCPNDAAGSMSASTDKGAVRTGSKASREQNSTYEQRENQADRSSTAASSADANRMPRRTDRGSSVNQATPAVTDPVTTPPVDDKGTRGSATKNTPPTGMKDQGNSADRNKSDSAVNSDRSASSMDKSCYIGQSTTAFALKLKDGRMLRFDDASNAKIAQQLQSGDRLTSKIKIFRATVKGSMQGDTIVVDSVQM